MNYDAFFKTSLDKLRASGDYRVFANLERHNGNFPHATSLGEHPQKVTIWCSNDYLGMGSFFLSKENIPYTKNQTG